MIILLSPSKSMNMEPVQGNFAQPAFLNQSQELIESVRKQSVEDLMKFMSISEKLATLNHQRFVDWKAPFSIESGAKPAALAFTGDVYDGLDAPTLTASDLEFAQDHLRILSGLYGLLQPLDLILPYRLEMGRPLQTASAKNLYGFWKETISPALNQMNDEIVINLASQEYFKAVHVPSLEKRVITPVFKDEKNGVYKIISFHAKKARGRMARYLIEHRVSDLGQLTEYAEDGYRYNEAMSTDEAPVFTRPE